MSRPYKLNEVVVEGDALFTVAQLSAIIDMASALLGEDVMPAIDLDPKPGRLVFRRSGYQGPAGLDAAEAWARGADTGTSSLTIWHTLRGSQMGTMQRAEAPQDPSDFGRCYRLLRLVPSWRDRLDEVADRYPAWAPFVDNWDRLESMYEAALASKERSAPRMYELMQALQRGVV